VVSTSSDGIRDTRILGCWFRMVMMVMRNEDGASNSRLAACFQPKSNRGSSYLELELMEPISDYCPRGAQENERFATGLVYYGYLELTYVATDSLPLVLQRAETVRYV
jgi:hypothetical protein